MYSSPTKSNKIGDHPALPMGVPASVKKQ